MSIFRRAFLLKLINLLLFGLKLILDGSESRSETEEFSLIEFLCVIKLIILQSDQKVSVSLPKGRFVLGLLPWSVPLKWSSSTEVFPCFALVYLVYYWRALWISENCSRLWLRVFTIVPWDICTVKKSIFKCYKFWSKF